MPLIKKFLTPIEAKSFVTAVLNRYSSLHDLPILGSGVKVPQSAERIANRQRQAAYRNTHARTIIWHNEDKQLIIDAFMAKLLVLKNAKSDYKRTFNQIASANSLLQKTINSPPDLTGITDPVTRQAVLNAHNNQIAAQQNFLSQLQATLPAYLAAYNLAKMP